MILDRLEEAVERLARAVVVTVVARAACGAVGGYRQVTRRVGRAGYDGGRSRSARHGTSEEQGNELQTGLAATSKLRIVPLDVEHGRPVDGAHNGGDLQRLGYCREGVLHVLQVV